MMETTRQNSTFFSHRYPPTKNPQKSELVYISPNIITNDHQNDKNYAVQLITEKYDTLRYLDGHMNGLQIADSRDSIAKSSIDGSSNSSHHESTTDDNTESGSIPAEVQTCELTDQEVERVEVFFSSHKTYLYVCRCLANLYYTKLDSSDKPGNWELQRTGIPVILLDKGDTKARDKRMLQIVLSEQGSGFVLWSDIIDNLSNYREESSTFHTMFLSKDHRQMAGIRYDSSEAAEAFFSQIEELTSDPLNISLSVPKQKKKKAKQMRRKEKVSTSIQHLS